jgi:transposase-like protein
MAKARRSTERRGFGNLVLQEYRQSGLSVRAFCERRGLAEPSFYAWRKRLSPTTATDGKTATHDAVQGEMLVPVRIVAEDRSQASQAESSARMEISTPTGYVLRFDGDVEMHRLNAMLLAI